MPNQRVVYKALAGEEDLLFGRGTINQTRAGVVYPISGLSFTKVVASLTELNSLDGLEFPSTGLIDGLNFTLYEYSVANLRYEKVRMVNARAKRGGAFNLVTRAVTPIITQSVFTRIEGTTQLNPASAQFNHTSGKLTYTGEPDLFKVDVNLSILNSNTDNIQVRLTLNGGPLAESVQTMTPSSRNISFTTYVELKAGDAVEVEVANLDSTTDVEATQYNVAVSGQ